MEITVKRMEKQLKSAQEELTKVKASSLKAEEVEKKVSTLTSEKNSLKKAALKASEEKDLLLTEVGDLQGKITKLENDVEAQQSSVEGLSGLLAESDSKCKALERELENNKALIQGIEQSNVERVAELEKQLKGLNDEFNVELSRQTNEVVIEGYRMGYKDCFQKFDFIPPGNAAAGIEKSYEQCVVDFGKEIEVEHVASAEAKTIVEAGTVVEPVLVADDDEEEALEDIGGDDVQTPTSTENEVVEAMELPYINKMGEKGFTSSPFILDESSSDIPFPRLPRIVQLPEIPPSLPEQGSDAPDSALEEVSTPPAQLL